LLHHDWSDRWQRILEIAGVPSPSGLKSRQCSLKRLAARVGATE
jgi:hypothetical protein